MLDEPRGAVAPAGDTRPWRSYGSAYTAIAIGALLLGFAVLPQHLQGDDATRAVALRQLAEGVMPDTKYSLIQPLVAVPLYWVLEQVGLGTRAVTTLPLLWLALWACVVWRLLVRSRSERFAYITLVLAVVSLQAAYVVGFSADLFSALAVSGGTLAGVAGRSAVGRAAGWSVVVIGAANSPALVAAVLGVALAVTIRRRRVRYLTLVPAALLLIAAEASWSEGHLTVSKYATTDERGEVALLPWGEVVGFGWPLWSGILAVLFSFGRGLVFYLPLWVAGPSPAGDDVARAEHALWIGAALLVPVYATWWAWYGGVTFGPRFFLLAAVPLAVAAAAALDRGGSAVRAGVLVVAILLNTWVAIAGAVLGVTATAFDACVDGGTFTTEPLCWYTPEYSSLWIPLWADVRFGGRALVFVAVVVAVVAPIVASASKPLLGSARAAASRARATPAPPWRL